MHSLDGKERERLRIVPMMRDEANDFVARHHRHSKVTVGYRFALGAARGDELVGVAIVGRPVARGLQDGWTVEALRVCTTGAQNACSFLYGACWRAARALGYTKLVTYTLASESGSSLRAAGLRIVGEVKGREWTTPSRPRDPSDPQDRLRWEVAA
jgi:hypothetical protein